MSQEAMEHKTVFIFLWCIFGTTKCSTGTMTDQLLVVKRGVESETPAFVRHNVNLANERLGAKALFATDEFFASKDRMLNPQPAVFIPDKYDDNGKWMDGWETRRKRTTGYDYCIVQLATPGVIRGVDLDTSYFTGNYPPAASLEACFSPKNPLDTNCTWTPVLPATTLQGDCHHYASITSDQVYTHLRVNLFPDGGLARLRVYGQPLLEKSLLARQNGTKENLIDLIGMKNGGRAIAANNEHYGRAANLLLPDKGVNMGDGWETRRRREPGNDWCIIALAGPGKVEKVEVDTSFFKGNFPDRCSIQAANVKGDGTDESLVTQAMFWPILLPEQKLKMNAQHVFDKEIVDMGTITHIRFNIIPDGGVMRLRLWGRLVDKTKM